MKKSTWLLCKGDYIRLKVGLMDGWKGVGIVVQDQILKEDLVIFRKDGDPDNNRCITTRHEVSKVRNHHT